MCRSPSRECGDCWQCTPNHAAEKRTCIHDRPSHKEHLMRLSGILMHGIETTIEFPLDAQEKRKSVRFSALGTTPHTPSGASHGSKQVLDRVCETYFADAYSSYLRKAGERRRCQEPSLPNQRITGVLMDISSFPKPAHWALHTCAVCRFFRNRILPQGSAMASAI